MNRLRSATRQHVDMLADPLAAEIAGRHLVAEVEAQCGRPDTVLVWDAPGDAVLAHIAARECEAQILRAYELEGRVLLDPPDGAISEDARRTLLLSPHVEHLGSLRALLAVARSAGLDVIGAAALTRNPALRLADIDTVVVVVDDSHKEEDAQ